MRKFKTRFKLVKSWFFLNLFVPGRVRRREQRIVRLRAEVPLVSSKEPLSRRVGQRMFHNSLEKPSLPGDLLFWKDFKTFFISPSIRSYSKDIDSSKTIWRKSSLWNSWTESQLILFLVNRYIKLFYSWLICFMSEIISPFSSFDCAITFYSNIRFSKLKN